MKITKIQAADGSERWAVMSDEGGDPLETCDTEELAAKWMKERDPSKDKRDARKRVLRVDAAGMLKPPERMRNGYLKVEGLLTRTGVFVYQNEDGTERRELRLPEEVFKPESIATFQMMPITDEHPPVYLDANNTAKYQKGQLGDSITREGKFMRAPMLITDKALVAKLEKGEAVEISNGYSCEIEERSGTTDEGERFDCIQRNIVGNHAAIVPGGRAGPEARVRMDSGADVLLSISGVGSKPPPSLVEPENQTVDKIIVAGVPYDAGSPQLAAAQQALQAKLDAEQKKRDDDDKVRADADKKRDDAIAELQKKLDANQAKADKAEAELEKANKDLKAAPAKVTAELKARMALEASATKVLGSKAAKKFDALDDKQLKLAVLKKTDPELKLDGKSDAYVDARFDLAIEEFSLDDDEGGEHEDDETGAAAARRGVRGDDEDDDDLEPGDTSARMTDEEANEEHTDSATAKAAMEQRHRDAWRQPLGSRSGRAEQ